MPNFAEQIEAVADDEVIIACVIGWDDLYNSVDEKVPPKANVVLTWKEARSTLNYNYDDGYGGVGSHFIYAWTESKVLLVGQYDGASWVTSVPRNPIDCTPEGVGGG